MAKFELSMSNNQEVFHVNEQEIEKHGGLILEYIIENEKLINDSILKSYDLGNMTVSADIVLTDDEEIRELNSSYRGKDKPTDVLSFALFADSPDRQPLPNNEIPLGEVIISIETAKNQADETGMDLEDQIDFLLCHGILHLLGFDHPDEESLEILLKIQEEILAGIKS